LRDLRDGRALEEALDDGGEQLDSGFRVKG